jgi:CHAP domain
MKKQLKLALVTLGVMFLASACSTIDDEVATAKPSGERVAVVTDCKFVGFGGYCTDGVLVIKNNCIPWTGNAKNWLANAKAAGYDTGSVAKKGAIVVFPGAAINGDAGHVGVMVDETNMWSMNDICGRYTWTKRAVSAYASSKNKIAPIGYIYYKLDTNSFPTSSCTVK